MKKMYEVFYDGEKLGLVRSTSSDVQNRATEFVEEMLSECGTKPVPQYDPTKIVYDDTNHDRYKHMM